MLRSCKRSRGVSALEKMLFYLVEIQSLGKGFPPLRQPNYRRLCTIPNPAVHGTSRDKPAQCQRIFKLSARLNLPRLQLLAECCQHTNAAQQTSRPRRRPRLKPPPNQRPLRVGDLRGVVHGHEFLHHHLLVDGLGVLLDAVG